MHDTSCNALLYLIQHLLKAASAADAHGGASFRRELLDGYGHIHGAVQRQCGRETIHQVYL